MAFVPIHHKRERLRGLTARWMPLLVLALLFVVNVAITVVWCVSMADMGAVPMAGGWTMSMMWLLMCGQTWFEAAASFLGMWIAMMAAMMLPSLAPLLWRYRAAVAGRGRLGLLTVLVGLSYFGVWVLFGLAVFILGATVAEAAMRQPAVARAMPFAAGVVVVLAGGFQFTALKARALRDCQTVPERPLAADAGTAWWHGWCLGLRCCGSCAGLTAILLVVDMMNLWLMALIAVAITAERLAPHRSCVVHAIGSVTVGAGALLIVRALA